MGVSAELFRLFSLWFIMDCMKLIKPTKQYVESWSDLIKELEEAGGRGFWLIPEKSESIDEYLQTVREHEQGKNLPDFWVPATTYWLVDGDKIVGHCNIRHQLTEKLKQIGGHIGYHIRPSERRKGYGSNILELSLKKAKALGLDKVLVTCDDSNVASIKIIEKNGGLLKEKGVVDKKLVRRYWIDFA